MWQQSGLMHICTEETVFTPDLDEEAGKSLFESGVDMLASVDRVKAIEGIHAMNSLRYVIPAFF
jgi:E3 ubiquitin-protein ligase UBR7